ncbi:MAG: ABC transporter permease [Candidatus Micrarchaeota archaeon]|nr:ABC transporter permease [Candidatus Micrarchaeota archaeon]MDE1804739.1 ABC transporter permease [Candidatus Micrarchaeota archaeon]MDE1847006.1 ABC transporter permease [Candidatus Micrarchaeota archaeon]
MSEIGGLYALWYREFKVFLRERSRLISSLVQPLMWLVIFGTGLGSSIELGASGAGLDYQQFIFPGILCMTVLFGSLFFGLYIIMDKRVDFMKEVLVAPLSRVTIFFGKVLGGATDGTIEIIILMVLGSLFFGIHFTLYSILITIMMVALLMVSIISLGLIIGSMMSSPEGFGLVASFIIFPLFFLSGALFPVKNLPAWLYSFVAVNPVSYTVDAVRSVILGIPSSFGMITDVAVMIGFAVFMIAVGTWSFRRMSV